MVKFDMEEIFKCFIFIVIGYFIAMLLSRMCSCNNGFSVGSPKITCKSTCKKNDADSCEQCTESQAGRTKGLGSTLKKEYKCRIKSRCRYDEFLGYTVKSGNPDTIDEPFHDPFQEPECTDIDDVHSCPDHDPACNGCYIQADYGDGEAYYECSNMETCERSTELDVPASA